MKEVYKNIYTFPVVLPKSPLREINAYVIKTKDRNLLIDTGYNLDETKKSMIKGLNELGLEPGDLDLVITHLHADHSGLCTFFEDEGAKLYAGKIDGDLANSMASQGYWDKLISYKPLYGLGEDEISITDNPGFNFKLDRPVNFNYLDYGEILKVGEFNFEILDLKGHTPGHIGLYDRNKKILFGGDTVLDPITPNITFWGWDHKDILGTYMKTLKKVYDLDLVCIFSAHRKIIYNPKERIDQLLLHHKERMQEILDAMEYGEKYTIRDISAKITWKIRANSWDDFPRPQKWFATGETMSHMEHMAIEGYLEMENIAGCLFFKKLKDRIS